MCINLCGFKLSELKYAPMNTAVFTEVSAYQNTQNKK